MARGAGAVAGKAAGCAYVAYVSSVYLASESITNISKMSTAVEANGSDGHDSAGKLEICRKLRCCLNWEGNTVGVVVQTPKPSSR